MDTIVEYMPFSNEKETEKMVDDLRTLGLMDLQMQMLEAKKKQNS